MPSSRPSVTSSSSRYGMPSRFPTIPVIVDQLLTQLAAEYEALQSENRALRAELQKVNFNVHTPLNQVNQDLNERSLASSPSILSTTSGMHKGSEPITSYTLMNPVTPLNLERNSSTSNADPNCVVPGLNSLFQPTEVTSGRSSTYSTTNRNLTSGTQTPSPSASAISTSSLTLTQMAMLPSVPAHGRESDQSKHDFSNPPRLSDVRKKLLRAKSAPLSGLLRRQCSQASSSGLTSVLPSVFELDHHSDSLRDDMSIKNESSVATNNQLVPPRLDSTWSPLTSEGIGNYSNGSSSANSQPVRSPLGNNRRASIGATEIVAYGTSSRTYGTGMELRASLEDNSDKNLVDAPTYKPRIPGYFFVSGATSFKSGFGKGRSQTTKTSSNSMLKRKCQYAMLSPLSSIRLYWDLAFCICLLADFWMVLFCLVYLGDNKEPGGMSVLRYMLTTFFCADIVMNFRTGYVNQGRLIMSDHTIAKRYLRFWFWIDFVATIPWKAFCPAPAAAISLLRLTKSPIMIKRINNDWIVHGFRRRHSALLVALVTVLILLMVIAHVHACLLEMIVDDLTAQDFNDAIHFYHESFWWAFTTFVSGSHSEILASKPWVRTFEIIIALERLFIFALAGACGMFQLAVLCSDAVHLNSMTDDALIYMRQHRIEPSTQLQVACTIQEITQGKSARDNFYKLASTLPTELRQTINREMWEWPLLSLELFADVSCWHEEFIKKLLLLVGEESVPSQTTLCFEGDPQSKTFKIMSGRLSVESSQAKMPDLLEGMWVSENALVNPYLRSSGTVITKIPSMLMSIPVAEFHQLLSVLGIRDQLKDYCAEHLWRGLCGRCGAFGDHFAHECHTIKLKTKTSRARMTVTSMGFSGFNSTVASSTSNPGVVTGNEVQKDLQEYLHFAGINEILEILTRRRIRTLAELEAQLYDHTLREDVSNEILQDDPRWRYLTPSSIKDFRRQAAAEVREKLEMKSPKKCLVFLSHYKVEAGTEAALMRAELQLLIDRDPRQLGKFFECPVFLDSENLNDLDALQQHVIDSHNLVLLLTKGVLLRPWVLVEILTACRNNVNVIPIHILKPEAEFEFPDDAFYAKLVKGEILDKSAMKVLIDCNIDLGDLEKALRGIFKRIAVRYSPHRAANIRQAELEALLREVTLRSALPF